LLLGVVVLASLGLAAADIATYESLSNYLFSRVDNTLNAVHPGVEQTAFGGASHGPGPDEIAPPGYCVELRTPSQRILASKCQDAPGETQQSAPNYPQTVSLPAQPNSHEGDRIRFLTVGSAERDGRYRLRASIEGDHPNVLLLLAAPLRSEDSTLHRLFLVELLVTAIVLAALAAVGLWIVRLGLRPLRRIEQTAEAITAGDLSRRVDHPDPQTEIGRVGSALNEMLDRIEASDLRLRRFIADASHELRTPLAAVRAYAELFGRGAATHPEDLERSMSGIKRESERMEAGRSRQGRQRGRRRGPGRRPRPAGRAVRRAGDRDGRRDPAPPGARQPADERARAHACGHAGVGRAPACRREGDAGRR
jgi:two-component system OmpR family sensor kinase